MSDTLIGLRAWIDCGGVSSVSLFGSPESGLLLATVALDGNVDRLFSATLLQSAQYVAAFVHGTPVLIDFAILQGKQSITDGTTENSTDQGNHHASREMTMSNCEVGTQDTA